MPVSELTVVSNPRRDREYEVLLSSDSPMPCRLEALQAGGEANFELRYTPGLHCIEVRSFGRYWSQQLQEHSCRTIRKVKVRSLASAGMATANQSSPRVSFIR